MKFSIKVMAYGTYNGLRDEICVPIMRRPPLCEIIPALRFD